MKEGIQIPFTTFHYRVRTDGHPITYVDTTNGGENPFDWKEFTTEDIFANKRIVLFSLPGAFTPTCSTFQVPGFEENYQQILDEGVDDIYVISVNDTFVMRKWMIDQSVQNIKFIPDGNGDFTRRMGMLVDKSHLGFGMRSWRYSAIINDCVIEKWWQEPDINDLGEDQDPYFESTPENCLDYLKSKEAFQFLKSLSK